MTFFRIRVCCRSLHESHGKAYFTYVKQTLHTIYCRLESGARRALNFLRQRRANPLRHEDGGETRRLSGALVALPHPSVPEEASTPMLFPCREAFVFGFTVYQSFHSPEVTRTGPRWHKLRRTFTARMRLQKLAPLRRINLPLYLPRGAFRVDALPSL